MCPAPGGGRSVKPARDCRISFERGSQESTYQSLAGEVTAIEPSMPVTASSITLPASDLVAALSRVAMRFCLVEPDQRADGNCIRYAHSEEPVAVLGAGRQASRWSRFETRRRVRAALPRSWRTRPRRPPHSCARRPSSAAKSIGVPVRHRPPTQRGRRSRCGAGTF